MSNFKYPKGSEWRKWDLHVHTPKSINQKYGGDKEEIWEKFISDLENLSVEFKVIGINDYLFLGGYEKVVEYKRNGRLKNIDLILPILEFRIEKFAGIDFGKLKRINLHVIFSNELNIETIKSQFLNGLEQSYKIEKDGTEWKRAITEDSLIELGKKIKASIPPKESSKYGSDLEEGFNNLNVDENKIFELLQRDCFKDKYLIAIGKTEWSDLKWTDSSIATKKTIINKAHIVFTAAESVEIWRKSKEKLTQEQVNDLLLDCSDAHYFSNSKEKERIGNCFTWIKADPTFEGLKQIIYEPELRVGIQEENPRENEVYARIEKCVINFPSDLKIKIEESGEKTDFCLQGKYEIEFSNNLTGIIGGRGTGKSTLIHLLCNACPKKDISKLEELNSPVLSLDFAPDPLRESADLTATEIPTNTEFFLQNEIEKFARDIHEMSNLIRHRLLLLSSLNNQISLKDLQNEWSMTSQAMNGIIEAYDNISCATKNIESVNKQIETLKKQIAVIKSKEYQNFQKVIEEINSKIAEFRRYKNEYIDIIAKIDMLITAFSQLDWSKEQGKGTLDELSDLLGDYKKRLKESFNQLANKFKTNNYYSKLTEKKIQLKKYLEKKGLTEENIEELADASEQIKELEDEIRILERQKVPFEEIYKKRKSTLCAYKEKYSAYQDRFFEVATRLEKELQGLPFFDKAISFTPKINKQRLQEDIVTFVKESNQAKVTLRTNDIQSVLFDVEDISEYLKSKEKIRDCVNQSTKAVLHKQIIQGLVNDPVFLEKLYLLLWKKYYDISNIQVQTKLGDKLLQNTSFGERCGIVISIILIAGTNPIVIDQPEDNLDGKFISNVLVPLIRKRKLCRQIILVTRDANLAIGGDAELIHILESDENEKKTKILPSSIENIKYRENYIWILDGGKEAFEKREKKYGFKTT
ncbi:MAG TPA: hypothetical protein DCK79_07450 [Candidatus Atribacteria bacterium]|nr:hypothetical protein [Candidatus Atribacteria bacterium]